MCRAGPTVSAKTSAQKPGGSVMLASQAASVDGLAWEAQAAKMKRLDRLDGLTAGQPTKKAGQPTRTAGQPTNRE